MICETLVKLGPDGERILIELLKNLLPNNAPLKASIISAFNYSCCDKTILDFIVEEIFKNSRDDSVAVRRACINCLEVFRNKLIHDDVHYLKPATLIPFFYYKL